MSMRELMEIAGERPIVLLVLFVLLPVAAWLSGELHGRGGGGRSPWKYVYAVLVYAACIPGLLAAVLTAYTLFFTGENLLDVNVLAYILPIGSMVVTLVLIGKNVSFEEVPGFDRLWGLMVMIGASFALALAVEKTRIWLVFGGPLRSLFVIAASVFLLLRWGSTMLFRKKGEPKLPPPRVPMP